MDEDIKRRLVKLELISGLSGCCWIVALIATLYCMYEAIFSAGHWWHFLVSAYAAYLFFRFALYCQLQKRAILEAIAPAEDDGIQQ